MALQTGSFAEDYSEIWGDDYAHAMQFARDNCEDMTAIANRYGHSGEEALAVVFPELLRYSMVSDFLETAVVETGYVRYGRGYGDFSIGRFQMKPSFVEKLEEKVCNTPELEKFIPLFSYEGRDEISVRSERVQRLKQTSFQIQYLICFISVAEAHYERLSCMDEKERIRFLATAYNAGWEHSEERIIKLSRRKTFPWGPSFGGRQYSYADISEDFYNRILFKPKK